MTSNILLDQAVEHKRIGRNFSYGRLCLVIGIAACLSLASSRLVAQSDEDTPKWQLSDQPNTPGIEASHCVVRWDEVKQR